MLLRPVRAFRWSSRRPSGGLLPRKLRRKGQRSRRSGERLRRGFAWTRCGGGREEGVARELEHCRVELAEAKVEQRRRREDHLILALANEIGRGDMAGDGRESGGEGREVLLSERRCEDGGTEEDEDRSEDGFGREDGGLEQRRRER
jgi:hypothetical protein